VLPQLLFRCCFDTNTMLGCQSEIIQYMLLNINGHLSILKSSTKVFSRTHLLFFVSLYMKQTGALYSYDVATLLQNLNETLSLSLSLSLFQRIPRKMMISVVLFTGTSNLTISIFWVKKVLTCL
jgi:hypothetical protein